jgi:hypothetical protein
VDSRAARLVTRVMLRPARLGVAQIRIFFRR